MSTGSEPYTLRGIPSKGAWALMTRLSPSTGGGPGAQPHIRGTPNMSVNEFSVHTHYRDESYQQGNPTSVIFSQKKMCVNKQIDSMKIMPNCSLAV